MDHCLVQAEAMRTGLVTATLAPIRLAEDEPALLLGVAAGYDPNMTKIPNNRKL